MQGICGNFTELYCFLVHNTLKSNWAKVSHSHCCFSAWIFYSEVRTGSKSLFSHSLLLRPVLSL